jgi:hypothetical protein
MILHTVYAFLYNLLQIAPYVVFLPKKWEYDILCNIRKI